MFFFLFVCFFFSFFFFLHILFCTLQTNLIYTSLQIQDFTFISETHFAIAVQCLKTVNMCM